MALVVLCCVVSGLVFFWLSSSWSFTGAGFKSKCLLSEGLGQMQGMKCPLQAE